MRVVLRRAAMQEITAASGWYDRQRPGLGSDFIICLERCVDAVSEHPLAFPTIGFDVRRALVRRFPFVVYYRSLDSETIEIVAVLHQRRDDPGSGAGS